MPEKSVFSRLSSAVTPLSDPSIVECDPAGFEDPVVGNEPFDDRVRDVLVEVVDGERLAAGVSRALDILAMLAPWSPRTVRIGPLGSTVEVSLPQLRQRRRHFCQ